MKVEQFTKRQFQNLVNEYLQNNHDLNNWRSGTTVQTYKKNLLGFSSWMAKRRLKKPRARNIVDYLHEKQRRDCSPAYLNTILSTLRGFFAWCEAKEIYQDITRGVKNFKQFKRHRRRAMNEVQLKRFFEQFDVTRQGDRVLKVVFLLMLTTGMRRQSLCGLRRKHLFEKEDSQGQKHWWIAIKQKGRDTYDHEVPLNGAVARMVLAILEERAITKQGQQMWPFTGDDLSREFRIRADRARLFGPEYTLHSLRHTTATVSFALGQELNSVKEMLGHSSVQTTADTYVHTNGDGKVSVSDAVSGQLREMQILTDSGGNESLNGGE